MSTARVGFESFVRRVHRRFVLLRLAERAGLGLLGGCAAAVPLLAMMWWRGLPGGQLAFFSLGVGILAGLLWGLVDRPTTMTAAMEADRQLNWADLLSSAISVRDRRQQDGWAAAVVADADARCRSASASSVILNRMGARSWGGVGLATALVLVLAMLPTYAALSQANPGAAGSFVSLLPAPDSREAQHQAAWSGDRRTSGQEEPEDGRASQLGSRPIDRSRETDGAPFRGNDRSSEHSTSGAAGQGTGQSHSDALNHGLASSPQNTGAGAKNVSGLPSAGVGPPAVANAGNDVTGGGTAGSASSDLVPPWQSSHWQTDVQRAHDAIRSGDVPDSYRDVIRGYFDRSGDSR